MKKNDFMLYGALTGALYTVLGSAIITIAYVVFIGFLTFLPRGFGEVARSFHYTAHVLSIGMAMLIAGTVMAGMSSIIPGTLGGVYLAYWLKKSKRAPKEIAWHSMLLGLLAGLIIVFVNDELSGPHHWEDPIFHGFAVLAIFIATAMSWLTTRSLAKDLEKFDSLSKVK
jgi:peptidoglycan/LPS O-acetylase OafA/YrhL